MMRDTWDLESGRCLPLVQVQIFMLLYAQLIFNIAIRLIRPSILHGSVSRYL